MHTLISVYVITETIIACKLFFFVFAGRYRHAESFIKFYDWVWNGLAYLLFFCLWQNIHVDDDLSTIHKILIKEKFWRMSRFISLLMDALLIISEWSRYLNKSKFFYKYLWSLMRGKLILSVLIWRTLIEYNQIKIFVFIIVKFLLI